MIELYLLLFLAADIRGVIVDPSGRPVPAAQVSCGGQTVSTDSQGNFTVADVDSCQATVSKTGFAGTTASLTSSGENRLSLELAVASESVVVTATGAAVTLEEAGVSATVITSRELQTKNFNRVLDVLRDVPGINVVQTGSGGGTTSVFSRGGESSTTVVLLDGIPLTDPGGSMNYVGLSTPGIERIEMVRGPESALYGAEAASGVIQLFSKRGDPEDTTPHGTLSYERGSFSADHWTTGLYGGFLKRFDYGLTVDQFRQTGQFQNNVFRNTSGTGTLGYRFSDRTTIRSTVRMFDSFAGIAGQTFFGAGNLDSRAADRDGSVGVRFDDARGHRFTHRATFAYHRLRTRNEDYQRESYNVAALIRTEEATPVPKVFLVGIVPYSTTEAAPGTTLVKRMINTSPFQQSLSITDRTSVGYQATVLHAGGSFIAGYDYERQGGVITNNDVSRRNNGISLYDQFNWGRSIFVTGGIRIEHSNLFGFRYAPRGAITFRLPTDTFLRLSLGRGIKQPTLLESFALSPTFIGNPDLKPAQTDTFEVGITRQWAGGRFRAEGAYFRNSYTDLIQFVSVPSPGFSTWQNVAKSWARGYELTGSARILPNLTVRGSVTRLYSRIVNSATLSEIGRELVRRPLNSGTASIEYSPRRFNIIVGARFVGNSRNNNDNFGTNRISAYNVGYMSASWQATKNLAPFLRINNLFNENYYEVSGFGQWSRATYGGLRVTW